MNRTLSLVRYAATEDECRRGSVVLTKQGRIKPDVMTIGAAKSTVRTDASNSANSEAFAPCSPTSETTLLTP